MGSALLETMTAQVTEECEANIAAAQEEAAAIKSEAETRAASQRETVEAVTEAEMTRLDDRYRQMAQAEASRADLVVKNDTVRAVMDKVNAEIRATVSSGRFPAVLEALLGSLRDEIREGLVVLGPEAHLDHIRGWLSNNGFTGVSVEASADLWDGVAVQDAARTYRISNTLTGRFGRVEQEARRVCMLSLFGTASAEGGQ